MRRLAWLSAGATAFCLLSIFNCGGYRYGVADQAFYIPAILQHLDPSLFPHDRSLFSAQDRLSLFNRAVAPVMAASGVSLPVLFLLAYVAGLLLLFGGGVRIGRIWYQSWWTVAALALVLTLRHRLTQTGVNTLEAYLHPRMLAFGVGVWSISSFLKGNDLRALGLVALAGALHPTTAIWFGLWVWVGFIVSKRSDPRKLPVLIGATLLVAAAGLWAIWRGPLSGGLVRMDPEWASVLAGKDYVFPSDWGPSFWLVNVGYLAVILPVYRYRLQHQRTLAREDGLVAGACALVVLFLLSWPLASARIALVIQLQVSRVFWMLDFLAALYLVWLGVEGLGGERPPEGGRYDPIRSVRLQPDGARAAIRRSVVAAIAVLAVARGGYVMWIEHADAPIVRMNLAPGDWTDVMGWVARTPKGAHILTDPGHVYKYGSSVRVAGERDVLLEEVTDTAMGMYARESAMRVLQRIRDLQNFDELTVERAGELAAKYDLDYLVIDRALPLPVAYRNDRFWVYELASSTFRIHSAPEVGVPNRSRDWFAQAERDLAQAKASQAEGRHEWACFAGQQAAEMAVKALHLSLGQEAWGHVVARLLSELPFSAGDLVDKSKVLDNFYVATRYANGHPEGAPFEHYGPLQSDEAIRYAGEILEFVRARLARSDPG